MKIGLITSFDIDDLHSFSGTGYLSRPLCAGMLARSRSSGFVLLPGGRSQPGCWNVSAGICRFVSLGDLRLLLVRGRPAAVPRPPWPPAVSMC